MEAFERHLRENFMIWKINVNTLKVKESATDNLLNKLGRRYKKLAFHQYYQKTLLSREEENDIKRGKEARLKLKEILL